MSYPPVTEEVFRETVKEWVQSKNMALRELASHFECALSTVDRWWLGTGRPHPLLQAQVVAWIRAQQL